jgi:hypothetical protein
MEHPDQHRQHDGAEPHPDHGHLASPDGAHTGQRWALGDASAPVGDPEYGPPESYLPPPSPAAAGEAAETVDALLSLHTPGQAPGHVPSWLAGQAAPGHAGHEPHEWPASGAHSAEPRWEGAEHGTGRAEPQPASAGPEPWAAASPGPSPAEVEWPVEEPPAVEPDEMQDVPLGTLIYRAGLLSASQLEQALEESVTAGKRLGEVLLDSGLLAERDLGRLLAGQKGLQFVELGSTEIDPAAAALLPASSARVYGALPIRLEAGVPVVAVSDPTNGIVVEGVRRALGDPALVVATRSDLTAAIGRAYGIADATHDPEDGYGAGHEHPVAAPAAAAPAPGDLGPATVGPVDPYAQEHAASATATRVVVVLAGGERVDVGVFADPAAAAESARELARSVDRHEPGEWPFVGGRFLRPDTFVAIELLEDRPRY